MNPSRRFAKNKKKGKTKAEKRKLQTCRSAKEATVKGGEHEARSAKQTNDRFTFPDNIDACARGTWRKKNMELARGA